jgi:adenine-specific DNA glycosylase
MQTLLQCKSNKYYIFRACVCSLGYLACKARAPYCQLCPAQLYNIFLYYLITGTIFEKKGGLKLKCVFRFYLQRLFGTFFITRRNERDMIKKMYIGLHVKYPLFLSSFN